MKKILVFAALGLAVTAFGQNYPSSNYPDNYPNQSNSGSYGNNGSDWGDETSQTVATTGMPDDYYYEYPQDYYPETYYQNYYNDYNQSIAAVNWNNFFLEFNLNPFQIREVTLLNRRFGSYEMWNQYYRVNPDRWYYDRFYALRRILGPQVFVVFQQRYYHGYNPVVYFSNYHRQFYATHFAPMPRYRNVDVRAFRVGRDHAMYNPGGFHNGPGYGVNPRAGVPNGNYYPRNNSGYNGMPHNNGNNNPAPRNNGGYSGMPRGNGNFPGNNNGGYHQNNGQMPSNPSGGQPPRVPSAPSQGTPQPRPFTAQPGQGGYHAAPSNGAQPRTGSGDHGGNGGSRNGGFRQRYTSR